MQRFSLLPLLFVCWWRRKLNPKSDCENFVSNLLGSIFACVFHRLPTIFKRFRHGLVTLNLFAPTKMIQGLG